MRTTPKLGQNKAFEMPLKMLNMENNAQ